MIENISINNYALIDHHAYRIGKRIFGDTGETGAESHILLGAIGLTLGQEGRFVGYHG